MRYITAVVIALVLIGAVAKDASAGVLSCWMHDGARFFECIADDGGAK